MFLNNAIYCNHKLKNDGEFSLDDIYFKDAFTKTEDKLKFMLNNKSESAYRILELLEKKSDDFKVPKYIKDAIEWIKD